MKNTPQSAFVSITRNLTKISRCRGYESVAKLRAYVSTPAFRAQMNLLDDDRYARVLVAYAKAQAECNDRVPPLRKPWTVKRAKWDDAMVARFRRAWAKTGTDEGAARLCGITKGAARLARKQFIDAPATADFAQAA